MKECKVLDIAVVPDRPGVCVVVTETFHDVASYHMLHANKLAATEGRSGGGGGGKEKFVLAANAIEGRTIPSEQSYETAR